MNLITITCPDETGKMRTFVIEYPGEPGAVMAGLIEHFCVPEEGGVDAGGKTLTKAECVVRRAAGDLIGLALQKAEQAALTAAMEQVKAARPAFTVATAAE